MVKTDLFTNMNGPLRVCPDNPRYFTDDSGKAIYLTGSHTWATLQEIKIEGKDIPDFDYDLFCDMIAGFGHNFTRLWQWGYVRVAPWTRDKVYWDPLPWQRTGPGLANDGLPKFDLTKWNEKYFERIRERVIKAGKRGIYVSVMFFDGWCTRCAKPDLSPWPYSVFNPDNNVNGIDAGKENVDGDPWIFTLKVPEVVEAQKAFMRKVMDVLNDLDNVMYEIANEVTNLERYDVVWAWHEHMARFAMEYEKSLPKQHLVIMSALGFEQPNEKMMECPAPVVSIGWGSEDFRGRNYKYDPPEADGRKIIFSDTDHLWGHGGTYRWAWKSVCRGLHPIFMDPWEPVPGSTEEDYPGERLNSRDYPDWILLRRNLGYTRSYIERMDINKAEPASDLVSSGYCLCNKGEKYLCYLPEDQACYIDLSDAHGEFVTEWFNPRTGIKYIDNRVNGGARRQLISPFGMDAVLFLYKV